MTESPFSAEHTPFERLGGEPEVKALVERFYDAMEAIEPSLTALHTCEDGKVSRRSRDRFALFLMGWLGGPDTYAPLHGHPRLRMRHSGVPINEHTTAAWLRCMQVALGDASVDPELRLYLENKLRDLAAFLRNQ